MNNDSVKTIEAYDRAMHDDATREIWADSDFCNFGFWREATRDHKEACENLLDELIACLPRTPGTVLDVACGIGATTGYIASRFPDATVVGVNLSRRQLGTARARRPGCSFAQMDAVTLAFPGSSFDVVSCVEAAFHFDTRTRFLEDAFRVLRPGGTILLTDILAKRWTGQFRSSVTMRNMTISLDEYRQALTAAGYVDVKLVDITTEAVTRLCRYHRRWSARRLRHGEVGAVARLMLFDMMLLLGIDQYLLVAARRPS